LTNNGSGGFVLASAPGVGSQPHCVTAADVNGDGKVDLISANYNANTLSVLTNNGSGGFVLASTPGVGINPYCVTAADVNGDGKVDLISANANTTTLSVLTNNGNGGFVLASLLSSAGAKWWVTAADVNGDGRPDLISADIDANTLSVWFNANEFDGVFNGTFVGTGQFSAATIGTVSFGSSLSQKINLYGTTWGMGIQSGVFYSRIGTGGGFGWYAGGVHSDNTFDAGGGSVLMTLTSGGLAVNGTFVSASDRNLKQDFSDVNSGAVLEKVAQLPIQTWAYKNDPSTKHLGPMAQDFYAAFAVGPDDKHITTVDESGVALAAIQGLNQKLEKQRAENAELKRRLEMLEKLMSGGVK
jgi:FG-GAP repeat.